jgi:hypothetical protein
VSFAVASALLGFGRAEKEEPLETPEAAAEHQVPAARDSNQSAAAPVNRTATTEA